jgi:hypothetical protein
MREGRFARAREGGAAGSALADAACVGEDRTLDQDAERAEGLRSDVSGIERRPGSREAGRGSVGGALGALGNKRAGGGEEEGARRAEAYLACCERVSDCLEVTDASAKLGARTRMLGRGFEKV